MIIDTSAIVALIRDEPEAPNLAVHLERAATVGVGSPTLVETGIVLCGRLGPAGETLLARFVEEREILVIPFGQEHWPVAISAFLRFGKGRHPARLNLADCMSYATARLAGEPLLCIGNDFAQTDLPLVS
ncbi:MAG TPA: type II toxin-antitoxin system VapC family toxin [Chloroflexota bacterium]|nr:type II toxin-antitoxin system VapC family toxin [Chloroflexota bacterium]